MLRVEGSAGGGLQGPRGGVLKEHRPSGKESE